jgi:DNA repair protein RecO (recombination protein O)
MNQIVTQAIVLSRTNYGEADRIITLLTPDQGKIRLMARGVRKVKSKLAGGIELFSLSDITFIRGKGEIGTLVSTRLRHHYGSITKDIERVQLGYSFITMLNRATEDHTEAEYYDLLEQAFIALNDSSISLELIRLWFESALVRLAGQAPNLQVDTEGHALSPEQVYNFDFENMAFTPHAGGHFTASHIKTLRLLFNGHPPADLQKVKGMPVLLPDLAPLIRTMLTSFIRV